MIEEADEPDSAWAALAPVGVINMDLPAKFIETSSLLPVNRGANLTVMQDDGIVDIPPNAGVQVVDAGRVDLDGGSAIGVEEVLLIAFSFFDQFTHPETLALNRLNILLMYVFWRCFDQRIGLGIGSLGK